MNEENQDFEALLDFLKRNRGFHFTGYKRSSLMRRIQRRMRAVELNSSADYLDYLEVHPEEFASLFNTILINVTSFFRDPRAWDFLAQHVIPEIIANKRPDEAIRVWSTGCASGEEAYSLAILFNEALGMDRFRDQVKIYATDLDEEALVKARFAIYTEKEVEPIPEGFLAKYFSRNGNTYSFHKDLRRSVIFGRNNLIQDAPISRIDLLVCRNTLMYFNAETQAKILARFHFALRDSGYLFLGKAEMLLTHTNIFTPVDLGLRIFRKVPKVNLRDHMLVMAQSGNEEGMSQLYTLVRVRDAAIETSPLAQLILDLNNTVVLANAQARSFFNLGGTDIGRPFQDLEISYRPVELRSALEKTLHERKMTSIANVDFQNILGESRTFDVCIQPLFENGSDLLGSTITFIDVTQPNLLQKQLKLANHELETAFEELQSTNEELETTNEELQSTIEELETTNEELQSTNEELETMNEELQSTNEELYTMNDELRLRTDELNWVNAFLESILTSVRSGVVVLDRNLHVLVWNNKAEDLWGMRADEVQGINFLNLEIGLPVENLKKPFRAILSGEDDTQEINLNAHNRRGREILCRVLLSPLSDGKRIPQGIIALMEEIDNS